MRRQEVMKNPRICVTMTIPSPTLVCASEMCVGFLSSYAPISFPNADDDLDDTTRAKASSNERLAKHVEKGAEVQVCAVLCVFAVVVCECMRVCDVDQCTRRVRGCDYNAGAKSSAAGIAIFTESVKTRDTASGI